MASEPTRELRGSFLSRLALTLAGAAAAIAGLQAVPAPPTMITRDVEAALARRGECELLFVGSSYVRTQILTDVVDAELRRLGAPGTSVKVSAVALRGYELRHHLERLLSEDWPRLRLVVVDVTLGESPDITPHNRYKLRVVEWHTLAAIPWLARFYDRHPESRSWDVLAAHAGHVAARYTRLGVAAALLAPPAVERETAETEADPPAPAASEPRKRLLLQFAGDPDRERSGEEGRRVRQEHQARVAELRRLKRSGSTTSRVGSEYLRELEEIVRARGAEAAFVVAPVYDALQRPADPASPESAPSRILDFDDPDRFPELYAFECRSHSQHLSPRGSELYSRLVVREILPLWRQLGAVH